MPSVRARAIVAHVIPSAPLGTDAAADPSGLGAATGATPERGAAERRFRFELAAHPGSVAQARRLTHARLAGWSVCADTCDNAALVVSELVTNAIVHTASSRVVCELLDHDDMVRIAVHDQGCAPGVSHPSPQRADEEHGRGLLLVDALCRAWGAQEHGPGLSVWAELPRLTDTTRHTEEPRGDLGWGARPKPGRPDDSDEDRPAEASGRAPQQRGPGDAGQWGEAGQRGESRHGHAPHPGQHRPAAHPERHRTAMFPDQHGPATASFRIPEQPLPGDRP
ncbi:ATP-binding protein [Streptomyces capoamus]|uniref:ATP-binding protein n=1 Tax=Streptomyces capoamus TaxID=68183 RepID=UPI003EBDF0DD